MKTPFAEQLRQRERDIADAVKAQKSRPRLIYRGDEPGVLLVTVSGGGEKVEHEIEIPPGHSVEMRLGRRTTNEADQW